MFLNILIDIVETNRSVVKKSEVSSANSLVTEVKSSGRSMIYILRIITVLEWNPEEDQLQYETNLKTAQ